MLDIAQSLDLLNFYLKKKVLSRSFIICGGAALILQGITRDGRITKDVDVLAPEIDQALKEASVQVANDLGLYPQWLNTDAKSLLKDLEAGWESRTFEIYKNTNLHVSSISRKDMIFAKFYAYCDRGRDLSDLIDLKVTLDEIKKASERTMDKDGNLRWPALVLEKAAELKKELGYE